MAGASPSVRAPQKRRKPWIASLGRAVDRRLTAGGRLVLIVTAFAAGFGIDTTLSAAYQVFSLGIALLAVAAFAATRIPLKASASRRAAHLATVGEPFDYEIELRNDGKEAWEDYALRDELAIDSAAYRGAMRQGFTRIGDKFNRLLGRPRTERRWRRGGSAREVKVPRLAPGASTRIALSFVPERRGAVVFEALFLFAPDPLGLARAVQRVEAPGKLVVLPRRYPVRPLAASGQRRMQKGGVANAGSVGDAEEFLGLREYRPGDPLRRIAWKRWARLGYPIVRENEDEFFVRQGIVLDTFCTGARAPVLDAATSVAASIAAGFAASIETRDALLDLVLVEDRAYRLSAGRGTGGIETLLEIVAAARPAPPERFDRLAACTIECAETASTLIVILLDWNDEREALLDALRGRGAPIVPIVMRAAHDPALPARAVAAGVRSVRATHLAADLAAL